MAKGILGTPIFSPTIAEEYEAAQREKALPDINPDFMDMSQDPFASFVLGTRNSLIGSAAQFAYDKAYKFINPGEYNEPLNFNRTRAEFDPIRDPYSFGAGNNLDSIQQDLNNLNFDEWGYVLGAGSFQEYRDRLNYVNSSKPEVQARLGAAGTAGAVAGMGMDLSGLILMGIAAEPLAIAGLGADTTLAARAAAQSYGRYHTAELAAAAAQGAATISRTNLAARYLALGIAEEAVYQGVKNGIDPTYNPTAKQVMFDLTVSGGISAIVGGAVFGRMFVKQHIEEAAQEMARMRKTVLPGGYEINWSPGFAFSSPAAADQMLFAMGTGSMSEEARKVAADLWLDWSRTTGPRIDPFIPGTRSVSLPQVAETTAERATTEAVQQGSVTTFKTSKGSVYEVHPDGTTTRTKAARPEHPGDSGLKEQSGRTVYVDTNAAGELSLIFAQGSGPKMQIQFLKLKSGEDRVGVRYLDGKDAGGFEKRTVVSFETEPRVGLHPLELWSDGSVHFGNPITEVGGQVAAREVRDAAGRIPARAKVGPLMGVRSVIKAAAQELSIAGMKLDEGVFATIAEALVRAEATKFRAGAFNKVFWEELVKALPPEVVANLRKPSELPFIGGVDRTVMDVVQREDMVTSVWHAFNTGRHQMAGTPNSLIFQVLQEIRDRGGKVNRQIVGEVIDELRSIRQAPPTRVNKRGATRIDFNARRARVIEIINKRSAGGKDIKIADSLLKKINATAGNVATAVAMGAGRAAVGGLSKDASEIPRIHAWWERIPGLSNYLNQAALLMESENGWARMLGHVGFNARRAFENMPQPTTIMEAGNMVVSEMTYGFMRGYRNAYTRFALGKGVDNVSATPGLVDALRTSFGSENRAMRREFNKRVAAQLRSGLNNDAHEAVNEAAKGIRELFNKMHGIANGVGLKGFTNSAVNNYFPRMWRFDRIRRLAETDAGKADLRNLIERALDLGGRKVVIDGVEQTFKGDLKEAARVFSERLINIAKGTENAPLMEQDQELFDALDNLAGIIKGKGGSKTPFGRARTILDESASVATSADHLNHGSSAMSLADLTNDDLPMVFRKYVTSVMGAVNEKRLINAFNEEFKLRGILEPVKTVKGVEVQEAIEVNSINELLETIKKLGGAINSTHESGMREVIAAMRYEPIHSGASTFGDKVLGVVLPYGYLTTGGQFGLAAMGEVARIIGTVGIRNAVNQIPILTEMVGNWRNMDRPTQNFASFIDQWFSPSTDRMRRMFMDASGQPDEYASLPKRALTGAANLMADASGLAPITSWTQQLTAACSIQHLYDVGRGARRLDKATLSTLGLTVEKYDNLIKFVGANAELKDGFLGQRVVGLKRMDAIEVDDLKGFVDRMVRTRIQDIPTRGDFAKQAFGFWGRLATQFRSFNIKGIDNFLIQNATRVARGGAEGRAKVASEIAYTMLFAGTIQYLRNYADWSSLKAAGNDEKATKLEPTLGIGGFVKGSMSGPSEFWLATMAADFAWTNAVDPDPIFAPYRYSGLKWYGFPGEAMGTRAASVFGDVYGATVGAALDLGVKQELTTGTLHKFRLLTPAQNYPGLKQILNVTEQQIIDEFNLPTTQSRTRD